MNDPFAEDWCDECAGPYPSDQWPGSQYAGHWDTCPNRWEPGVSEPMSTDSTALIRGVLTIDGHVPTDPACENYIRAGAEAIPSARGYGCLACYPEATS